MRPEENRPRSLIGSSIEFGKAAGRQGDGKQQGDQDPAGVDVDGDAEDLERGRRCFMAAPNARRRAP